MSAPAAPQRQGILCVVSGPSGSGKTTLCRTMSERDPGCVYSVSCTTRPARAGEVEGRDYHFMDTAEFEKLAARGEMLEFARVHGNFYGTLKRWVLDHLAAGTDVVMDIDVQGAAQIRACEDSEVQRSLVDVFILPPSLAELRGRLSARATEDGAQMALRLANALEEMACWRNYQYAIVSGARDDDLARFAAVLAAERTRTSRLAVPPGLANELRGPA